MDGRIKKPSRVGNALFLGAVLGAFLAASAAPLAHADDLPAPQGTVEDEVPVGDPPAQEPLPDFGTSDTLPDPMAAQDSLPEPTGNPERSGNQVNRAADNDEIFLPTPATRDNINYAPLGTPVSSRTSAEDNDWRIGMSNRPAFSLQLGAVARNYGTELVPGNKFGGSVAGSWRVFNIAQTVFLHAYASATFIPVGDVAAYSRVNDFTLHVGPMVEIGIGRRLSLYGSFLRRSNTISAAPGPNKDPAMLNYVDEPTAFQLGFGAQWDFHVVPHGSLGARVHVERDMALFYLTMAIEPVPRRRLSLNYEPANR